MIFHDFPIFAPNPWAAWMFAREKGLRPERREVDLFARENRQQPFLTRINPLGELPAIELDDGTVITELPAICEYLEEVHPQPPLIGATPLERAETRMWLRRIDNGIAHPLGEGIKADEARDFFLADRERGDLLTATLVPVEAARVLKAKARDKMLWLDRMMQGRTWVCGERFTLADIYLYCFLEFGEKNGQPVPEQAKWLKQFFTRMKARPTAWHGTPGALD